VSRLTDETGTVVPIRRPYDLSPWCPVDAHPMRSESAGPLGWVTRCTFDPEHWAYGFTSDPNTLAARATVAREARELERMRALGRDVPGFEGPVVSHSLLTLHRIGWGEYEANDGNLVVGRVVHDGTSRDNYPWSWLISEERSNRAVAGAYAYGQGESRRSCLDQLSASWALFKAATS
jgi:hypothetical protein